MQRDTAFVKQQVLRCREYQKQKSVLSTGVEVLVLPADRANGVSDKGFWLLTEWALANGKAVWLLVVGRSSRSRWHWGAEISTSASNESKHTNKTTDWTEVNSCCACVANRSNKQTKQEIYSVVTSIDWMKVNNESNAGNIFSRNILLWYLVAWLPLLQLWCACINSIYFFPSTTRMGTEGIRPLTNSVTLLPSYRVFAASEQSYIVT